MSDNETTPEYTIEWAESREGMISKVNQQISQRWRPVGSLAFVTDEIGKIWWLQPMMRWARMKDGNQA